MCMQDGWTPLHVAAKFCSKAATLMLLDNKASVDAKSTVCAMFDVYTDVYTFQACNSGL
jgi:hypothetical protein